MSVPCPACNAGHGVPGAKLQFAGLPELPVQQCPRCRHHWLPTSAELQRRIEERYGSEYGGFRVDPHFVAVVRRQLSGRLRHLGPESASLLDVGCGNGEFLRLASAAGFACEGIDVSEAAAQLCRSKGLRVSAGDFLSQPFDSPFHLVTMWDVLEHLREPFEFVARAFALLRPGGTLVLKIPSPGQLVFRFLHVLPGRGGALLSAPAHVQYFNEGSLAELLRRAGFEEVIWLDSIGFRGRARSWNPRRILSRELTLLAARLTRNTNLYALAVKGRTPRQVVSQLRPRRVQLFSSVPG
jgi:SAM-dependent methyltransferase